MNCVKAAPQLPVYINPILPAAQLRYQLGAGFYPPLQGNARLAYGVPGPAVLVPAGCGQKPLGPGQLLGLGVLLGEL